MIIRSKISRPVIRQRLVDRDRLLEKVRQGAGGKLTLIAGPAGFGKTSLVSQWLAEDAPDVAWLTADENDSDQGTFLAYFVASLRSLDDALETLLAPLAQTKRTPSAKELFGKILVELSDLPSRYFMVLDDYHLIQSNQIRDALFFFVNHLPRTLHLTIITRSGPPFPLAKLRAQGELTEIGAPDLKFTEEETSRFFAEVIPVHLEPWQVRDIVERTEGWPIGVQMAGLSLQARKDAPQAADELPDTSTFALEYLLEEVLQSQPEDVQGFLLRTSILRRLHPELCNDIVNIDNSSEFLSRLETGNVFILPADDSRTWYRYHNLFSELLRERLQASTISTASLHKTASRWFADRGHLDDAFHHAFASQDMEFAADLLEERWFGMIANYQLRAARNWIERMPAEILRGRFLLMLYRAWIMFCQEDYRDMAAVVEDLDESFETMTVAFPKDKKSYAGDMLRALKVGCLFFKDLSDDTVETAVESIETISQDNLLALGFAYGILAYGYVQKGELLKAGRPLNASIDIFARIKHSYFLLEMISLRADVERAEGQLRKSDLTLEEAFDRVRRDDFNMTPAVVKLGIRKAYIHYARNQLEEALELARKVNRYVKSIAEPGPLLQAYYIESFVQDAMGHPRQARNLMDEAVAIAADSKSAMRIAMIESYSVELALRQGDLEAAATWAEGRDLSLDGPYSQEIEKECLLMARIHLARGEFREALRLLEKLRPKAEERRRYTAILTMDIVRAAAYWALGEEKKGLAILAEAIEIAQPEGYVRPFVDQSAFITDMLLALRTSEKGPVRIYIPALIKECMRGAEGSALTEPIDIGYGEVLTPREAEFARLICAGLTNKEIADATFVTMNTVKTHIRHIFGKLGVTTRDEMILRAKDLKLV